MFAGSWWEPARAGCAGLLIGGVGGRLAMFVLRLTSSDSVRDWRATTGLSSVGSVAEALFLLAVTTLLGATAGMLYVGARALVPRRLRIVGWAAIGGVIGGAPNRPSRRDRLHVARAPLARHRDGGSSDGRVGRTLV